MALGSTALAAPQGDLGSIISIHVGQLTTGYTSSSRCLWHLSIYTDLYRHILNMSLKIN